MAVKKNYPHKWEQEKLGFILKSNDDLVCRDCVFRDVKKCGVCEMFPLPGRKPRKVLMGGACSEYHKE